MNAALSQEAATKDCLMATRLFSGIWHLEDARTRTLEACATVAQPSWLRVLVASSYQFREQCRVVSRV